MNLTLFPFSSIINSAEVLDRQALNATAEEEPNISE